MKLSLIMFVSRKQRSATRLNAMTITHDYSTRVSFPNWRIKTKTKNEDQAYQFHARNLVMFTHKDLRFSMPVRKYLRCIKIYCFQFRNFG